MNKRSVCRIHKSHHCMVHRTAKNLTFAQSRDTIFGQGYSRWIERWRSVVPLACRHVDPQQSVLFAQRIAAYANARRLKILPLNERRYGEASSVGSKSPSVIRALNRAVGTNRAGG